MQDALKRHNSYAAMQLFGSDAEGNEDDIAGVDSALAEAAEEFDLFAYVAQA